MGLFSKFKEANHKRNQTRNSIFLSTDSVTSNTSSETSNFKHPVSSNNKPKPKPRPKSEYYDIRKLPKARQEKQHSRSYSNQENELPLVGLSEDTLQFDANDISLDEVTEHLIDPQLFAVMDKSQDLLVICIQLQQLLVTRDTILLFMKTVIRILIIMKITIPF